MPAVGSAGGIGTQNLIPAMPPQVEHAWLSVDARHKVDQTRRAIHALNSQHALIFMNFQSRLKVTFLPACSRQFEVYARSYSQRGRWESRHSPGQLSASLLQLVSQLEAVTIGGAVILIWMVAARCEVAGGLAIWQSGMQTRKSCIHKLYQQN